MRQGLRRFATLLALALVACGPRDETPADEASLGAESAVVPSAAYYWPAAPAVTGGLVNGVSLIGSTTAAELDAVQRADGYVAAKLAVPATCGASLYEVSFKTSSPDGRALVNATAAVLLPTGGATACAGPRPLLAVAPGTNGDTSLRTADPSYWITRLAAAFYTAQGFVVVIPDYLGNGSPTRFPGYAKFPYHPYLHAQSEATVTLDAIRAVRSRVTTSGKVMFAGASQGAHAALSAHGMAAALYGSEFAVVAGAYDIGVIDVPGTMSFWQTASPVLHDKAKTAWAALYNGGAPLTSSQLTASAKANDLLAIPYGGWNPPVQLCGYAKDPLVPFAGSVALKGKLGTNTSLVSLSSDEVAAARGAFPGLDDHTAPGTLCLVRQLAFFRART